MSGYSEVINLTRLTNNYTNVELAFRLRNEVVVDCVEGGHCGTNVNNLPLPIYALLSESQASHVSFHAPSGDWNERLWGQLPITSDSSLTNHQGSVHTSIAATVNVSNWPVLRSHLATLLRTPLNPSRVDINQHPMKLLDGRAGVTQHKQATFTQVFPLLSANADTLKAWTQNLLPCQGKSGIGALLDAHALHDSLWYAMSLDITIHRTPSVSQYNYNTCEDNASTTSSNEKICTASTNIDNVHTNNLDETLPGTYNVEVKVSINMVVPTTTAASSAEVQNMHQSATYNKEKKDINILHSIQRASYLIDGMQPACSINDPAPSIRYDDGIHNRTFTEIPLNRVGKGDTDANKMPADRFWDNIYSSNGHESMSSGTAEGDYDNNALSVCKRDLMLRRKVFDSRSMEFKVLTTILPRAHNPAHTCLNTTNTNTFHESIPDSYAIDLSHYRYVVVSSLDNSGGTSHNITSEGFVHDLPGFQYVDQDCETIALSNSSSRQQNGASSVPTCQPGYTFLLPDLPPHSALLLTYIANKRLLSRESQPIDASRGAVVPPAVLYACNPLFGCSVQATRSFIVTLPIPDSSMPYNVITLVSTLLAFFLGSFINALHKNSKKSASVA